MGLEELEQSLSRFNLEVRKAETLPKAVHDHLVIVSAGAQLTAAKQILKRSGVVVASVPESLALVPAKDNVLLACGSDARGLVYALLELSDRLNNTISAFPRENFFRLSSPISEQPANSIRSVLRLFASDVEDKPWFNDREFWSQYLTMLATQRFNRFNLSLSLGYDFLRRVTDAYFLFPLPVSILRARIQRPSAATDRRRTRSQPRDVEVHQRADSCTRTRLPAWTMDAWLRMDR
jgi:hypothetical protein